MKTKNIILYLIIFTFIAVQNFALPPFASNTNPVVENVEFTINEQTITVTYDIKDDDQTSVTILMYVSENDGLDWGYDFGTATGDIGTVTGITFTTTQKAIEWTYSGTNLATLKIKIIANDEAVGGNDCGKVHYEGGPNDDFDGNGAYYNTIQIGNQCWLKENLNVGTRIDSLADQTSNSVVEKHCYRDNPANCTTYGGLYQWAEALQYANGVTNTSSPSPAFSTHVQGICPSGWHIPTKDELQNLLDVVDAGGLALHQDGVGNGTNTSGFSALFAGYFELNKFGHLNHKAYFWSITESTATYAYYVNLLLNYDASGFFQYEKADGFSIRCLKN